MCGRYQIDFAEDDIQEFREIFVELNKKYAGSEALASIKTGEIFPTNLVPILASEDKEIKPTIMQWGFPRWDSSGSIINARAETAADKNMFKKPLAQTRCVVPTTGFYEWQQIEGQKRKAKYLFRLPNTKLLYLAGIHNVFAQPDGTRKSMFVVLTTAANESMIEYHNRMPVIIQRHEAKEWVLGNNALGLIVQEQPSLIALST